MPVRELGVDAAVLFADIMLPLEPMGVGLRIEPEVGPIIDRPIRSAADVAALRPFDPAEVSFTLDAIRLVRRELDGTGRRDRLLGRAVHARLLPDRGPPVARLRDRQGVHVPRAGRLARPDGAAVDDGRGLPPGPGRRGRRGRPAVRQLGRRASARPTTASSSSPTSGGSSRRSTACRRSTSGPGTAALLELMAEAGGDVIGRRPPGLARGRAGGASATTAASRATSTRPGCSPAGRRREAGARAVLDDGGRAARPRLQPRPRRAARAPTRTCCGGSSTSSTSRPPDRSRRR